MKKEFIPYEQALELKELGFDEPCFRVYDTLGFVQDEKVMDKLSLEKIQSPTFSQAFRWLYQKLDIEKGVMPLDIESQQLLLKELIDKVSSKHLLV